MTYVGKIGEIVFSELLVCHFHISLSMGVPFIYRKVYHTACNTLSILQCFVRYHPRITTVRAAAMLFFPFT
jgi:hypothetical protein